MRPVRQPWVLTLDAGPDTRPDLVLTLVLTHALTLAMTNLHELCTLVMATLTITRGLPGSGKTTWARQQPGAVRVNRDELRRMLHGGRIGLGWAEVQVTLAQRALVSALLRAGLNVVCDDTNLRAGVVRELRDLAESSDAQVVVRDFTDVPLDECIRRDAARPGDEHVGAAAIREMWRRYLADRR